MKTRLMTLSMLIAAWALSACAGQKRLTPPICGTWSSAAVTNTNVVAAATFAIEAVKKSLSGKTDSRTPRLELIGIREAAQQVVAGVNYRLTLTVRLDGREKLAEAVVWWQVWRTPDPYRLTSWNWR
jgi:hypothetical protein